MRREQPGADHGTAGRHVEEATLADTRGAATVDGGGSSDDAADREWRAPQAALILSTSSQTRL